MADCKILATVPKATKDTLMGVGFCDEDGMVIVASLQNTSPFYGSLDLGYQVVSVENVSMEGKTSADAAELIKNAVGTVSICARQTKAPLPTFSPPPPQAKAGFVPGEEEIQVDPEEADIELGVDSPEVTVSLDNDRHQIPMAAATEVEQEPADVVQFEAPSDLPAGYELEAEVGDNTYVAVVPEGGVKEGDLLTANLKSETNQSAYNTDGIQNQNQTMETIGDDQPQVVSFAAPSDLPGGYNVEVEVDGVTMIAVIPPGGVREGEMVTTSISPQPQVPTAPPTGNVIYEQDGSSNPSKPTAGPLMQVPTGKWRDGFCECCEHCGRPVFWMSWCASLLSLGQVMTRMNLNWCGDLEQWKDHSAFWFMVAFFSVSLVYFFVFVSLAAVVPFVALACYSIYFLVMTIKTRSHIRRKYGIQGGCCEDCCLSFWCTCCTVIQMASHTADFQQHDSKCCTPTGLSQNAPPNVHVPIKGNPGAMKEKMTRRKLMWGALAVVALIFLIVGSVVAANGNGIRVSSSNDDCDYKYCYVYDCNTRYNAYTGRYENDCGYQYQTIYTCDSC